MLNKMNMQIFLGRALYLWKAETNKWILIKKTIQAMQLVLLIFPPPLLGLCPLVCPFPPPTKGCILKGWMKAAAEACAGMSSGLGLVWFFPLRSPI